MNHPSDETLRKYAGGQLSGKEVRALEDHLVGCGRCRREIAVYQAIDEVVLSSPVPDWEPDALLADVSHLIRRNGRLPRFSGVPWRLAAMAAAMVLALGVALFTESAHFWQRLDAENAALYAEHYSFAVEPHVQPVRLVVWR